MIFLLNLRFFWHHLVEFMGCEIKFLVGYEINYGI